METASGILMIWIFFIIILIMAIINVKFGDKK
jgi:hypothetical protein